MLQIVVSIVVLLVLLAQLAPAMTEYCSQRALLALLELVMAQSCSKRLVTLSKELPCLLAPIP